MVRNYYASVSGYKDELLWAALWLYKATDNQHYLHYTLQNAHSFGGIGWSISEFSWDVKYAGLQIFVATQVILLSPSTFFLFFCHQIFYLRCRHSFFLMKLQKRL